MQSFRKKIKSIIKHGLDPIAEGIINFNEPKKEIEYLASLRLETCLKCPLFKREPISMLAVEDERLKEASKMFCDECGCTLPYKLRQSKIKCDKWEN